LYCPCLLYSTARLLRLIAMAGWFASTSTYIGSAFSYRSLP
jgi:hypothetical protein